VLSNYQYQLTNYKRDRSSPCSKIKYPSKGTTACFKY